MSHDLTELDQLLLSRWSETSGMWTAIKELEDRMADRLEALGDGLKPWLESQGYVLVDVDRRWASLYVAKPGWLNRKGEPDVFISVSALYPYGFRRVQDEHPTVWICCGELSKPAQEQFREELTLRLSRVGGEWLNDNCSRSRPAGRFVQTHGDAERIRLAQSEDELESFVRAQFESVFVLGPDIDAALRAVRTG